jgi:YVTN family beta-propeller protein
MINKQKLYSIALISAAMILITVNIAGAAPFAYITNSQNNNVSVIDTATNKVTATIPVSSPNGVAVTPDGKNVYATSGSEVSETPGTVYVINTTTNKVTTNITVGSNPIAIGQFIGGNIQKAKLNSSKTKASLSKHKQKNHSKHHKTEKKKSLRTEKLK